MKKNSLELKKRQHQMLIDQERKEQEKRERRSAAKAAKTQVQPEEVGEVVMKKPKFQRHILPRREYKAQRRKEKLAKYAPRMLNSESGDVDMADLSKPKNVVPVSKTLRLVKDKHSIRK